MKSVRQKYDEAAKRNAARFFGKGGIAAVIKERSSKGQQIDAKFKSVDTIKHRLGIRKTDGAYDGEITLFVGQVTSGK